MIVLARHIWLPIGTLNDRTILVPFSADHMVASRNGTLHAAKPTLGDKRRKTIDTICGTRAYPVVVHIEDPYALVPIWPLPVRYGLGGRCPTCSAEAVRKKPDAMYRDMDLTTGVTA